MKIFNFVFVLLVACGIFFGFVIPWLLSQPSDLTPIIAIVLILLFLYGAGYLSIRKFKKIRGEKDEKI